MCILPRIEVYNFGLPYQIVQIVSFCVDLKSLSHRADLKSSICNTTISAGMGKLLWLFSNPTVSRENERLWGYPQYWTWSNKDL